MYRMSIGRVEYVELKWAREWVSENRASNEIPFPRGFLACLLASRNVYNVKVTYGGQSSQVSNISKTLSTIQSDDGFGFGAPTWQASWIRTIRTSRSKLRSNSDNGTNEGKNSTVHDSIAARANGKNALGTSFKASTTDQVWELSSCYFWEVRAKSPVIVIYGGIIGGMFFGHKSNVCKQTKLDPSIFVVKLTPEDWVWPKHRIHGDGLEDRNQSENEGKLLGQVLGGSIRSIFEELISTFKVDWVSTKILNTSVIGTEGVGGLNDWQDDVGFDPGKKLKQRLPATNKVVLDHHYHYRMALSVLRPPNRT